MRKTHKFQSLKDVAEIVAKSPSVAMAAKRLGVQRSTVHRWIEAGKVPRPSGHDPEAVEELIVGSQGQNPEQWAEGVRKVFSLSETDLMLLDLATRALEMARDPNEKSEARLSAMSRYQQLVKQLNLSQPIVPEKPESKPVQARKQVSDPRAILMAV